MRVLVLGGYGLIGSHVVRRLLAAGHEVVGLGRSTVQASRRFPTVPWIRADLRRLDTSQSWDDVLRKASAAAIVNCAGALQDGARDDVAAVHTRSMTALYDAAGRHGAPIFVQISATRADPGADTAFMRTKGEADAALRASGLDWVVLRPGLVFSPQAYGGTALLRALAAMPLLVPVAHARSPIQTVSADDVAEAVLLCLHGGVERHATYDLVEDEPHSLREIVLLMRGWLGLPAAPVIELPRPLLRVATSLADALGRLGWRSPMRSTALHEIAAGVKGDPDPWRRQTGRPLPGLEATLATLPATVQERWFARTFLLKPLIIGTLSLFWIVTALVTWADPGAAARVLVSRGSDQTLAAALVHAGAIADLLLGLAILHRSLQMPAALGMIAVTIAYLTGATLWASDLWADPLGPLVKALPAMMLAVVALALQGDR